MSAVSSARPRKVDPLSKRIPENPKYKHVKATVDTGASLSKYMARMEDIRLNYKFRKGEIFKRIKITTFAQLLVQVYRRFEEDRLSALPPMTAVTGRSGTTAAADAEVQQLEGSASPAPSLALTDGDYGAVPQTPDTARSTLLSVAHGIGELDVEDQQTVPRPPHLDEECPYLLLDVRDKDEFNMCHIVTAVNYPKANLARTVNYDTKEMMRFKNAPGKIIVIYDEDERIAPLVATTLAERDYSNLFMLSGGLKLTYKLFPERLLTGTPSPSITGQKPPKNIEMASNGSFSMDDINCIEMYLDNAIKDNSIGTSRLSKASTTSSRMNQSTGRVTASSAGYPEDRPPFKP